MQLSTPAGATGATLGAAVTSFESWPLAAPSWSPEPGAFAPAAGQRLDGWLRRLRPAGRPEAVCIHTAALALRREAFLAVGGIRTPALLERWSPDVLLEDLSQVPGWLAPPGLPA